jgi:5-methylcytosine-specific restriction endonuclease McrA
MPIRPENKARYPAEWPLISLTVRALAGFECAWCDARQGEPHPITGSRVVLTVAHLDHQPENCADPENMKALCQRCHNRYDAPMRRRGIKARARDALRVPDMFE